jgi:hypothetical protein
MPQYEVALPNGKKYRVDSPEPLSQDQVWQAVQGQIGQAPKEGILAALTGGTKRLGSTLETGLESLINPELAAKRGAARQEEIGQQYAPGASLEKVKQAYEQKGLFPAAYEAVSQIPAALAEQAPQIASAMGGARVGATAGSMFGPTGALVGGIGGAFVPSLAQLYGANLERQAQEKAPEISRAKALGAAVPGAGLEVASTFIPLGRNLIGKLLGPEAEKALARGASEGVEAAAKESLKKSLAKGAGVGALAEVPTEVTQQMLERLQAGLPVTTPDALAEYGEAAYGAAMVGAPFGAAARGLGRPAAREQYANQLQIEQLKVQQEEEKKKADALKKQQESIAKTEENLGVPKMLALPAPAKEVEVETDPLLNPIGRITEDELGKAIGNNTVVNYLNKYRKENNLPKLKSYSIEDIKDAMTAQNPEGEEGALNSILAYKTNYQNENYTPEDIQNRAVAKNVATETKGWNDFLTRTTGKSDVNTMTQPELHSVATALDALKRTGKEEQLVLPEGSNATRFTQDQYNQGITTALMGVKEGKPVSLEQAREAIKAQTDLKTDRDADHLLKTAASNEDLIVEKGTGFQAVSPGGVTLGTYGTEAEARRNHRRADILPVETELVRAPEEINQEKVVQLPEGYEINKKTVAGEAGPAAYVIREADSQKNASQTFAEEGDAKERLNILTRKREANALAEEAAADRIRQDLEKKQAKIAQMEADGQADTVEHKNAVNAFQAANVTGSAKITEHLDKAEAFRKPLKIVPLGKKTAKVEKHVVTKGGKPVASFDTNDKAQSHVLSLLDNNTLESIAERGGVVGERAKLELDMRERPGVRGGTTEGLEKAGVRTPEVEAKLRELEAKLVPMLKKFGLGDVGLKVVRAIENDAEGAWGGLNNLIRIAFEATNPIRTMRHEALHALKELGFFTPQQWEALKRQANKTWVDKYLKNVAFNKDMSRFEAYKSMGLSDEAILEEAIADAFGDFEAAGKAPAGMLDALFKRLQQFFAALRQGLTGAGFESADEIFGKIERGELKAGKQAETEGQKYSLAQVSLNTIAGPALNAYKSEYLDPISEAVAKGNSKPITLKDGTQVNLVLGAEKTDDTRGVIAAVDQEGNIVGRLVFYKNETEDGRRFGPDINVNQNFRRKGLATAMYDLAEENGALIPDLEPRQFRTDEGQAFRESRENAWKASKQTIEAADKYEEENGIRPYVSEGFLDLPTDGTKYSLQKYNPEKHLSFDATLGVPINKDGLITLYYHTTKEKAVQIGNKKIIPSEGRNRVYLTNESNGADVLGNRGNFDQELDGSTVLVYVHPDMLQVDDVQENGRRDFFIPLAQGDFFNKKMKLQSIQKSRTSPITEIFSYTEHEQKIADAVNAYKNATPAERRKLVSSARKLLKQEHNVGSLLSENGKLEKTRVGEYDLDWDGNSVASMGLGLASAQQISEKVSTCPRSAICEGLCLGETSGGNFMFGGAASEDVGEIKKSSFRAAARMMQYLKTEALIVHPEEFAMVLQAEIDSLAKWCASETQNKRNPETKKNEKIEKEIYQPAVRLNVTSDFKPSMFRAIIEANPDTMFYDYTKLGSESIAHNHHLTYSSTGFGQIVNGEKVFFKDKSGKYDHNWATMRSRLNKGQNVAMAFSSKSGIPSFLVDEETGVQYRVWNGDDYDARFLDPKQPDGKGMIIGLKNKAGNLKESTATKQTGGFFVQYDPKTDGDTVVVPSQNQFKGLKDVTVTTVKAGEKYSLRAPDTKAFKQWFGDSQIAKDNEPVVLYHATSYKEEETPNMENVFSTFMESDDGKLGAGIYASSIPKYSESYAINGTVMPLYASIKNPFVINIENRDVRTDDKGYKSISPRASSRSNDAIQNEARKILADNPEFKFARGYALKPDTAYLRGEEVKELLQKGGYDGVVMKDGEGNFVEVAAFSPEQYKSAIGNKGTYSAENPDIRYSLNTFFPTAEEAENAAYQKAPPSTPEFKRFFGASKVKEEGRPQVMYHASTNVFDEFRENKPIFISPDPKWAEQFGRSRAEAEQKDDVMIYPLWVRAETPFDFENKAHAQKLLERLMADSTTKDGMIELKHSELMGTKRVTPDDYMKKLKEGDWTYIENDSAQAALKTLGFDSFYVKESGAKNLAVLKANQVKSVTGNIGEFGENKDIRYSLREFKPDDLPKNNKPYTLPENTMIFHGAHGAAAKKIEEAGKTLLAYPGIKSSGGSMDEAGLIFFGGRETATDFANSQADQVMVEALERKEGKRLPGTVFETATDRPYKLMSRYQKLSAKEANELNAVLGLPDYKKLKAGDSADLASSRAYTNSRVLKEYNIQRGEQQIPMKVTWPVIFRTLGFDGFYDNQNVPAVALTADNGIKLIGDDGRLVKYSLPVIPAAAAARRDATTQQREQKGFIERILDVFKPESMADLRASFVHRYNQLGVYDKMLAKKMGDRVLMADMSAEAAANMSDLSASVTYAAFGIGNRRGGIPVYKNGTTTIDNSVKGPLEILSPLAQFNDPTAYQDYQYWAGVKRGSRFMTDGREKNFDASDIALAEQVRKAYLAKGVDFNVIQKEMNIFNDGLVDYMKATGVLAPERAAEFKKHMDYIPFYRQLDGQDTIGPKIFNSISGVKPPKKLKGSEAPLTDYLESIVQNTQAAINAGMKNMAAQRAINVAMQLGPVVGAQRLNAVSSSPDTVQVLENGKQVSYRVADQLFINAVKNLNMAEIPFMGIFSAPSNMLRNLVTKDPGFMLANLARDSLSAWVTSGSNMTPIAGTVSNFVKALSGKDKSLHALYNAGILGGYEFSSGVIKSGEVLEKDLSKRYGSKGVGSPLKVFSGVWDALEKGTEASDAATRMAVYERVLAETGNETEALYRALEVMNFNRKGSSPVVRILTAAIPFLNARIQGLDVFYRTAMGKNVLANSEAMQKAFFVRGATLMALSAAYFLAVSDDDEWKKQEQETKDNYWIAPGIGKFPTPFEVGFLFKTVPERIMAYTLKDDTGQDLMDSMRRGLLNTFAFNPIPQIAKPLVEYSANYNFFTGRPIVGQGMEGLEPQYQVGPNTTQSMEWLGKQLGMSPIKLEQVYGGYTGTMGMYALSLFDSVLQTQSNSPHASKRFEQLPIIKRFAADPEARGNITQYYELKKAVDAAVQTENLLLKSGKPEEFAEFMEKNAGLLAIKPYVANVEKSMKQMREMRKMVQGAEMSGDEKRDTLTAIGQAENNLNANIQTVKKMVSEFQ